MLCAQARKKKVCITTLETLLFSFLGSEASMVLSLLSDSRPMLYTLIGAGRQTERGVYSFLPGKRPKNNTPNPAQKFRLPDHHKNFEGSSCGNGCKLLGSLRSPVWVHSTILAAFLADDACDPMSAAVCAEDDSDTSRQQTVFLKWLLSDHKSPSMAMADFRPKQLLISGP